RHPLVDHEQGDGVAAPGQLAGQLERLVAGARGEHAMAVTVPSAEIALDGSQDRFVVVDGEDCRHGGHAPECTPPCGTLTPCCGPSSSSCSCSGSSGSCCEPSAGSSTCC